MRAGRATSTVNLGAPLGFRIWANQQVTTMRAPHTHADIELNFLSAGSLRYRHGGVDRDLGRGELGIFWGGIPHQLLCAEKGVGIWMTLPILWLLRWSLQGEVASRLMAGEMLKLQTEEAPFARWQDDFKSGQPARLRALQLELEATFQRISQREEDRRPGKLRADPVSKGRSLRIEQVTSYLAIHYKESLSLTKIAKAVRVHSKYLSRVFKGHCGLSVWEYLTRLRVAHAQRLLRTTDAKIIDVALESGFGSLAPFYAAFERYGDGKSPRGFRLQGERES